LVRVALLSGGKDSFYAAMQYWPPDFGLVLVYDAPSPSPHLVNLGKSVETLLLAGVRVVVLRLRRGRERADTVEALERLGATEIVAGDVFVEDHLRYLEGIAGEVGAKLREPLWGMDTEELLYRIVESGIRSLFIGVDRRLSRWLGRILGPDTAQELASEARRLGLDPLGENGEYHTVLLESPHHEGRLSYRVVDTIEAGGHLIARLL